MAHRTAAPGHKLCSNRYDLKVKTRSRKGQVGNLTHQGEFYAIKLRKVPEQIQSICNLGSVKSDLKVKTRSKKAHPTRQG